MFFDFPAYPRRPAGNDDVLLHKNIIFSTKKNNKTIDMQQLTIRQLTIYRLCNTQ